MSYKYLFSISCLLFCMASVVYGYLTGSTFFFTGSILGSSIYKISVPTFILFSFFGVAIFISASSVRQPMSIMRWFGSALFGLAPVFLLVFFLDESADCGGWFRIYIAPISLCTLIVFSIITVLKKKYKHEEEPNVWQWVVMSVMSFGLGILLFVLKGNYIFQGNKNFLIQFVLSLLCVVLPLLYMVIAMVNSKTKC